MNVFEWLKNDARCSETLPIWEKTSVVIYINHRKNYFFLIGNQNGQIEIGRNAPPPPSYRFQLYMYIFDKFCVFAKYRQKVAETVTWDWLSANSRSGSCSCCYRLLPLKKHPSNTSGMVGLLTCVCRWSVTSYTYLVLSHN